MDSAKRRDFEIDRAFGHLQDFLAEKKLKERGDCNYAEGDFLLEPGRPLPQCTEKCCFRRLRPSHIDPDVFIFACNEHHRIHRCGVDCAYKVLSHEAYTCPRTCMVIPLSLKDDDQANGGVRRSAAEGKRNLQGGDEVSEKCRKKHVKNTEAIADALDLCSQSFNDAGICKKKFTDACHDYLMFLHKNAEEVSKNLNTKRAVSHFALAMAFMHRTGYTTHGVTLFKHFPAIGRAMPKSHGLSKKKYKMRAITRIQDALRSHIRHLNAGDSKILVNYAFKI